MNWVKRVLQAVAWLLLLVVVPLAMATTWAREEIFDQDQYMASVDGLAADPDVQNAIATRLGTEVDALIGGLGWEQFVADVTGDPAVAESLLAMNIDVETFIHDQTLTVMNLPEFQTVWLEINQRLHPIVEQVLRGEESDTVQSADGVIRVSLYPVYNLLVDSLTIEGVDLRKELNVGEDDLWLTFDIGDQLVEAQQVVKLLNDGSWALLVIGVLLAAVLIGTASRRWLAGLWVGIAVMLGGLVLWIGLSIGGSVAADQLADQLDPAATRVIVYDVTHSLLRWAQIAVALGAIIIAICGAVFWRGKQQTSVSVEPVLAGSGD